MAEPKVTRTVKVLKLRILKPVGSDWDQLGQTLRDTRYRVFRLANLAISECYLNFHLWRTGRTSDFQKKTIQQLNRELRSLLADEGLTPEQLDRFSKTGALPDTVVGSLWQYKLGAVVSKSKWSQVVRGQTSLPTFCNDMAIPIRCDKPYQRRLEQGDDGEVYIELMLCQKPYPRILIGTNNVGDGQEAVLKRLLSNVEQSEDGYRQRCLEVKQDNRTKKWWLYVTYDFAVQQTTPREDIVVGVDLGVSVPLYAAINNGHARLGRRQFQPLGQRIRSLQNQVDARRRSIQRGGRLQVCADTARTGHGRKRKLAAIGKLEGRVNNAYTTLNHQLSAAVIQFARDHGAGTIQIEDLEGLKEELTGTFIGARWRYHQLQAFLAYKAEEAGIKLKKVNPRYTSRRCSHCGFIHADFDRAFRDSHRVNGKVSKFICPNYSFEADPDYNAARNLATLDIENLINVQCQQQNISQAL